MNKIEDPDRGRGIFSKRMREYLMGEYDGGEQAKRKLRHDIRERVKNAMYDAALLHHLEKRDREQIMGPIDAEMERGIAGLLGFIYVTARDSPRDTDEELAEWLEQGVTQVSSTDEPGVRGPSKRLREASVELSIDEPVELDLDTLRDKVERRAYDELTENEKLVLIWLAQRAGDAGIALERRSLGFDPDELLSALADDVEDEMGLRRWINLPPEAYDDAGEE